MTAGASLLPPGLQDEIDNAIAGSADAWNDFVATNAEAVGPGAAGQPLAIKYVPSKYAATYKAANMGLFIGSSNFTWGRGVYVTGVEEPLSTAMYGRVGVVCRFDPGGWRAFDARIPANQTLYLYWLHAQPAYAEAVLTVHSEYWLDELRNQFREQFHIDAVLFHPDERDFAGWYTQPLDTWLAVSDWQPDGALASGYSNRFTDARLVVLVEEEFAVDAATRTRVAQLSISGAAPVPAALPAAIRAAYAGGTVERVPS